MSKRGGDSTRASSIKKRRGVGSRTIAVLDSDEDEEGMLPTVSKEYARVTKTRVGPSGKAERVSATSIPILKAEESNTPIPLEENIENSTDVVEGVVPAVPAKRQKTINDSVSNPTTSTPCIANNFLDQDGILA
jgi:hypothetical protein